MYDCKTPKSRKIPNGTTLAWLESHVKYDGDKCLIWPFARWRNGYGVARFQGRNEGAHRIMLKLFCGNPPTKKHYATHSCGCGHLGCVNPKHLRWATPSENQADRISHKTSNRGERHGMSSLSRDDVIKIREMAGAYLQREIAEMFGIRQSAVSRIISRKAWGWL